MNIKEFAQMLDGRQYHNEITVAEVEKAKELGYIIVCGYSDDGCEIYGAFREEYDCYEGGVIEDKRLPKSITAVWCDKDRDCAWSYKTDMPYAEFNIFEDDELYCVGMVIDLKESKMSYKEAYEYLEDWDELNFCAKADAEAIETARQALLECIKDGKER